ncbi:VOC family protein [Marinomonas pollencensis]|uniref:Catechol 2,3-dioxygenase-like lactoylglutathione lyase family enzyme n=1 Tax=Marinomonas pollencensis TaxID=491954 RepID=A0A3E0DVJ6_9GAMM|nr:VOC family protein [Marinomonas pollencensis]REG86554.1 catechol 2,3-dioxygenase-like lactoylglutathione lyase family enzyme [Marinomonas pollencensis]
MNIRFDHLSLSAKHPEVMRDFLVELLGLKVGKRSQLNFKGYFLFAGDKDVIHIFGQPMRRGVEQDSLLYAEQNIVHHVSFFCDDYQEVLARVERMGLAHSIAAVPDSPVKQIFVRAPENLILEIQGIPQ